MLVCRKTSEHRQKTLSGHVVLLGRRDVLIFRPFFSFWPICTFDGFDINRRQGRQGESFMVYNLESKKFKSSATGESERGGHKIDFCIFVLQYFLSDKLRASTNHNKY